MMQLNFALLSDPMQKMVGQRGTGGTTSNHAGFACPTVDENTWDAVGQAPAPMIEGDERLKMSHLSHHEQNKVGRRKPSIHAAVPLVPPVPPTKHMNEIDREAFEERAAIMRFDGGLPRSDVERLAAESLRCKT